jgi:endonuclease/exonuclease/phosphatase family metal-dependent hydrolase
MRISVYNLHLGGTGRADPLAEVLLAGKPDIVVTTEATDPDVLSRLAARLSMDFAHAPAADGRGVAVFTSGQLLETVSHHPLGQATSHRRPPVLESLIRLPNRPDLRLFAAEWVSTPDGEAARIDETRWLVDHLRPLRDDRRPHLIAGTLHTLSPGQSAALGAAPSLPSTAVYAMLEGTGYVDSYLAAGPTTANPEHDGTYSTQNPRLRLDYLWAFGPVPTTAWIETDRLATYASDHFPTGAEFAEGAH